MSLLDRFKKNKCRFCSYVSCCVKCRIKHEIHDHNINPECDICVYGKISLRDPSKKLLEHIKSKHWPLHCSYCKKVFFSIDDIFQKCSFHKCERGNTLATPQQNMTTNVDYLPQKMPNKSNDSNTLLSKAMLIKTSTPMHQINGSELIKIIPQSITPVENPEKKVQDETTPLKMKTTQKVTFSEELSVKALSEEAVKKEMKISDGETIQIKSKKTVLQSLEMTQETSFEVTLWNTAKDTLNRSALATPDNRISSPPKSGKWPTLTDIFNNVAQIFLKSTYRADVHSVTPAIKRLKSIDSDDELLCPNIKKMKLTELKCRKPIHVCCTPRQTYYKKKCVDKWTQTEW